VPVSLFGWTLARRPQGPITPTRPRSAVAGAGSGGWQPWTVVHEPYSGAWQENQEIALGDALHHPTVWACATLIATDIGKLRARLMAVDDDGIWTETESAAFSPVLRKPNRYQTRIKFFETWMYSKLLWGNAYALKARDERGVVVALYLLDPQRVTPLVADDGSVYYELDRDTLAGVARREPDERVVIPAREIIHDVMVPLYHPLVGVSPIYACGTAAQQGLQIQDNSTAFFANQSRPGGLLIAPGPIADDDLHELKAKWQAEFSGGNAGKIAVLSHGLQYTGPLTVNAVDADLVKQLQWSDEKICSCFHVPAYMVGVGPDPNYANIQGLSLQYYAQCLQTHIESIELLLDEGLELPKPYGVEFDLDDLLRMDTPTMIQAEKDAIGGSIKAPNESRRRLNLPPVPGGESPLAQQQYYSLAALAARDAAGSPPPTPAAVPVPEESPEEEEEEEMTAALTNALRRKFVEAGWYAAA
jgi:HK97 family phage portal protein